jgi:hypothetical protein
MMKRPWALALLSASAIFLAAGFAGCGSDNNVTFGDSDGGDEGGDENTSASDANGSGNGDSSTNKDSGGASDASKDGSNFFEGGVIPDASRADSGTCHASGDMCATSSDCCSANCDKVTSTCGAPISGCKLPGVACLSGLDCCTGSCAGGTCSNLACVQDNLACATNTDCCSGSCAPNAMGGGTCAPLPTAGGCKSINNACKVNTDCCSGDCNNGTCAAPSYCGQNGDTCGNNDDCCGGICTKIGSAVLGLCSQPTQAAGVPQCTIDGQLCGGLYTGGGSFQCGGTCCSKSCRPYAPTGYLICEPASGCHPTGELCMKDTDCCGAVGLPYGSTTQVKCSGATATTPGRCANGNVCSPSGNVCKLASTSCSTSDVCCGTKPNSMVGGLSDQQYPLICQQDNLGIPRCLGSQNLDCTQTDAGSLAGKACASSADCCGDPCLPNGSGTGFICGSSACVNSSGICTTTADCCSGLSCTIAAGSSSGICGGILESDGGILPPPDGGSVTVSDGGAVCSQYGQLCVNASDCCAVNGAPIPCTSGRCLTP